MLAQTGPAKPSLRMLAWVALSLVACVRACVCLGVGLLVLSCLPCLCCLGLAFRMGYSAGPRGPSYHTENANPKESCWRSLRDKSNT